MLKLFDQEFCANKTDTSAKAENKDTNEKSKVNLNVEKEINLEVEKKNEENAKLDATEQTNQDEYEHETDDEVSHQVFLPISINIKNDYFKKKRSNFTSHSI